MNKLRYILSSSFEIIKTERATAILAVIVLIVSSVCSVFLLSYGYSQAEASKRRSLQSRCWIIETDGQRNRNLSEFSEELSKKYDIVSLSTIGTCEKAIYGAAGEKTTKAYIGCELIDNNPFSVDYGKALSVESAGVFVTGDILSNQEQIELNEQFIKVVGIGTNKYNAAISGLQNTEYYVTRDNYETLNIKTQKLAIIFRTYISEDEYDSFIKVIDCYFHITDINIPEVANNEKIEKAQFMIALFVIILSFINIFSVFSYIFEKSKKYYNIMRLCGATKTYIFIAVVYLLLSIVFISYLASCALYYLVSLSLINTIFYYDINGYIILIGLVMETVPALGCAFKLIKNARGKI